MYTECLTCSFPTISLKTGKALPRPPPANIDCWKRIVNSQISRTKACLILVFSALCLANLVSGLWPARTSEADIPEGPLESIRWSTGTRQNWTVFHTIPFIHRNTYSLVAEYPDGTIEQYDPGLPGLQKIDCREMGRYHSLFINFLIQLEGGSPELLEAYLARALDELQKRDPKIVRVSLRADVTRTRVPIQNVKEGDPVWGEVIEEIGPYPPIDE